MTLVVGINLSQCALVTADSRVTTRWSNNLTTRVDCCQKVFRIGEATIAGFCGDLIAIADVLSTFAQIYQFRPELLEIQRHFEKLPLALKLGSQEFYRRLGEYPELGIVIAGRNKRREFEMFSVESPDYDVCRIEKNNIAIMGSGTPIVERLKDDLQKQLPLLMSKPLRPFTEQDYGPAVMAPWVSWIIASHVESRLKASGISTVGRAFHTSCIDSESVWPIPYEIARQIDVDKKELVVGTKVGAGSRWVQFTGDGTEIELVSPIDVVLNEKLVSNDRVLQAIL